MSLPSIKEKISQVHRSRKILFSVLLALSALAIISILVEVAVFFYFGYHRQRFPAQGVRTKVWVHGRELKLIVGTIVKKEGNIFTVEKDGDMAVLEVGDKVFYCGETGSNQCSLINISEVEVGQLLTAQSLVDLGEKNRIQSIVGSDLLVRTWD